MHETLVSAIRQEKKTKWIQIVKEANLFIPICCSQKFYKKHLEMINNFSRVTEYKINLKKPFTTPTEKNAEKEMMKMPIHNRLINIKNME